MGSKETSVKKSNLPCKSSNSVESSENSKKEIEMMDFESGIDTWVIDKEDSNGSCYTLKKPDSNCTFISTKTTVDKENITRDISSTGKNSLRCFRIRKDVSYKELSSESENESKSHLFSEDDNLCRDKKQQNKSPKASCFGKRLSDGSKKNVSKSLNDLRCINKEKESLSSEEITLYLSEFSSSSDSIQEKSREHLHSIENVSSISESKVMDEKIPPKQLKFNCNILRSSSEFNNCTEVLNPYENVSNRISLASDKSQCSQVQNQKIDSLSLNSGFLTSKPEFLDTYKSHLTNKLRNGENQSQRDPVIFKDSLEHEKYSICNKQLFKCNVCSYCCSDLLLHKSHLILFHSEKKILDCEYCDYQTSQCANLATHIRIHFQLECPHCDFQCPVKKSLESHLLTSHGRKTHYVCKKCDFTCKSLIKFQKHSQTHIALGKYKCSDCNRDFKNKITLKTHVKEHLNKEKAFKCFTCSLSFCKKQELNIHLRSHEQSFVCDICNFKSTHKHKLEIHMMKVHTRKSLKCGKCSSVFSKKSNLKLHMRVHFAKSKCRYCPFQSSDPNELSKHICIKNLYNAQKRTLNFENKNQVKCDINKKSNEKNEVTSNLKSTVVQCAKRKEDPMEKDNNKLEQTKSALQRKKQKLNMRRLLSLRSHLPLKINKQSKNETNEEQVSRSRHVDKLYKTLRTNNIVSYKLQRPYKKRNAVNQTSWVVDQVEAVSAKENIQFGKRTKLDHLGSLGLYCTKPLLSNKLITKEILLEPVRLTNSSYIQCYYQSQSSINTPNHLERHIRQSPLLSCRFCNYKTNSRRLLQRHTAKNHTWDPAVVNILFS